jgi:hypothetical protein
MLLAVLVDRAGRGARAILTRFLVVFLTLGLLYFLWRWQYFGYPLPNPFYKKGGGTLYWHSLRQSWKNLWALGWPFLWLVPTGLAVRGARKAALFVALPVVLFVTLFVLISDETNYVMRFRYPILPVLLLGCVPVAQALWAGRPRLLPAALAPLVPLALAGALAFAQHQSYRFVAPQRLGLYDAGLVLRDYAARGFALVTTEAGLLPLVSEWRAVDAWGLNDKYVAHHGGIDEAYLERYRPELIVFHAYFSPRVADHGERVETRSLGRPWYRMVMTLKGYAGNAATCSPRASEGTSGTRTTTTSAAGCRRAGRSPSGCARSTTTGTASPRSTWRRRTSPIRRGRRSLVYGPRPGA